METRKGIVGAARQRGAARRDEAGRGAVGRGVLDVSQCMCVARLQEGSKTRPSAGHTATTPVVGVK